MSNCYAIIARTNLETRSPTFAVQDSVRFGKVVRYSQLSLPASVEIAVRMCTGGWMMATPQSWR